MNNRSSNTGDGRRWVRLLGWSVIAYLGAFAALYAEERLYSDSSYYLMRVVNNGWFHVEHGRIILALSQLLPVLGVCVAAPLKALVFLYSMNNVVILAITFVLVVEVLDHARAGTALISVHIIGLTHGLFCPMFELYYGVDLTILLLAWLDKRSLTKIWQWPALVMVFVLAIGSHFTGLLLMVMCLVVIGSPRDRVTRIVLLISVMLHTCLRLWNLSDYEGEKLGGLGSMQNIGRAMELFSPRVLYELLRYTLVHYADVLLLTLCLTGALIGSRRWRVLLLFLGGVALLYTITHLYLHTFAHDRYLEQVHFAIAAWVVISCCMLFPVIPKEPLLILLIGCVGYRVHRAEAAAERYAARTSWLHERVQEARSKGMHKAVVEGSAHFSDSLSSVNLSWSTATESMLLSSINGPDSTVSLITLADVEFEQVREQLDRYVHRRWEVFDHDHLSPHYFELPSGRYEPLDEASHDRMSELGLLPGPAH